MVIHHIQPWWFIRLSKIFTPKKNKSKYQHLQRGANWTLRDGELTPFRNHLTPLWRCWYPYFQLQTCFQFVQGGSSTIPPPPLSNYNGFYFYINCAAATKPLWHENPKKNGKNGNPWGGVSCPYINSQITRGSSRVTENPTSCTPPDETSSQVTYATTSPVVTGRWNLSLPKDPSDSSSRSRKLCMWFFRKYSVFQLLTRWPKEKLRSSK